MKQATKSARVSVSETNLTKAALRLLNHRLVSPEIVYVQQQLGRTATQEAIDDLVIAVRKMPWSSIVTEE